MLCISEVRSFVILKVTTRQLCVDGRSYMQCTLRATPCSWCHGAVQSVVCHQDLTSKLLHGGSIVVQLFASRASSRCKHDMGTLSWLNAETLKRALSPLFGRLVRCSAVGTLPKTSVYVYTSSCWTRRLEHETRLIRNPLSQTLHIHSKYLSPIVDTGCQW